MSSQAPVTVVIPSYNGRELLEACLASLRAQSRDCRVIVVDDGSEDGSAEMVSQAFPEVQCLALPCNVGFVRAANAGLRRVESDYAALLNNDTEADPGWIEAGLEGFRKYPECGLFASKMVDFHDRTRMDGAGDIYTRTGMPLKRGNGRPAAEYSKDEPVLGASAGAAFYRTAMLRELGYFDEAYHMYLEDVDLSLRAQLAGYRCRFLHRAVVYHMEAASDPELGAAGRRRAPGVYYSPSRVYWITRNRWQLMWTYQPLRNAPWLAYGWAKSALFHLLKAGYFIQFLKGSASGIACVARALRKRRRLARSRRIPPSQLCRLLRAS